MKRFLLFVMTVFLFIAVAGFSVNAWAQDEQEAIPVSVTIDGVTSLTVNYLWTATGTTAASPLSFDQADIDGVTLADPWVVAEKCLEITYESNYFWGLRIVSDNWLWVQDVVADAGEVLLPGIDDYILYDELRYGNPLAIYYSYSGLLSEEYVNDAMDGNDPATNQDPSRKAILAWMVQDEHPGTAPTDLPTSTVVPHQNGEMLRNNNVGECWDIDPLDDHDSWGYISDKNDVDELFQLVFLDAIYIDPQLGTLTYPMVAMGFPGSDGNLVPFAPLNDVQDDGNGNTEMIELTNNDFIMYVAGRFASTNWNDQNEPIPYILTPDTYEAYLYVELIHE